MGSITEVDHLILYDGDCPFCNKSIQFILSHEKNRSFTFASLQSANGQELLSSLNMPLDYVESLILYANKSAFIKSNAVLGIARYLTFPWNIVSAFGFLPRPFRDSIYNFIAKNRYKLLSKEDYCMVVDPLDKERFLD